MLSRYRLFRQAEEELHEIRKRYDEERSGSGYEFFERFEATVQYAMRFPNAGAIVIDPELELQVRRFRINPFRHRLITAVHGECLVVIAIAHPSRDPGYWAGRLDEL